jgi:DNA-binding response OmpR family regulator
MDSVVGRGTSFRLHFPVASEVPAPPAPGSEERTIPAGTETVLLVEDEDRVRALSGRVLRARGYKILEATDGRHALEVVANYPETIDIAILDVVMPHIGGRELAERLRELRPDTAILFVSGYTDDEVVRRGVSAEGFLQKPFTLAALAQRVRSVLDRRRKGPAHPRQ